MKWWRVWGGGGCVRRVFELSARREVCVCVVGGGGVGEKERERWRKWIEIADALWGLQKINSSQEGKPQPPSCAPSPSTRPLSLQSSSFCFFLHSFPFSLSPLALSRFHVHFHPPPLLHIHSALLLPPSHSSFILTTHHCYTHLVFHPVPQDILYITMGRCMHSVEHRGLWSYLFIYLEKTTQISGNFLKPVWRCCRVWK